MHSATLLSKRAKYQAAAGNWSGLQGLLPKLASAYRWLYSGGGGESEGPRNAVSRDISSELAPSALPGVKGKLLISDDAGPPLWIGWTDGEAPFKITVSAQGKLITQAEICGGDPPTEDCLREALLPNLPGTEPLELKVTAADRQQWATILIRQSIPKSPQSEPPWRPGPS